MAYELKRTGKFAEVEINRNVAYYNAPNKNSRTFKILIKNITRKSHSYLPVIVTGDWGNWLSGAVVYLYPRDSSGNPAPVTLNPGEMKIVELDVKDITNKIPDPNMTYGVGALNIYVDGDTEPDIIMWKIWTLDVKKDDVAYVAFDRSAKYSIDGNISKYDDYIYFHISDVGSGDFVPINSYVGIIVAINPFDRTGAVVDLRKITTKETYYVPLQPVPTGFLRVKADMIVDYSKLGNWLGGALSWLTALGADLVSLFINNGLVRYLFLHSVAPILKDYWGAQNISIDAYVDPNDPTKVHIVITTYYNVNDDPLPWLAVAVIAVAVAISIIGIAWIVDSVTTAEAQKKISEDTKEITFKCIETITNPNLSQTDKEYVAKICGPAINARSQTTGIPICEGWAIGNSCISWKVFLAIAAVLAVILILVLKK